MRLSHRHFAAATALRRAARAAARRRRESCRGLFRPARVRRRGTSTAGRAVMRKASPTLPASSPPDSMNGTPGSRFSQQPPVERPAEAARSRRFARRAGIEQQPVGDRGIAGDGGKIALRSPPAIAFITGRPKRFLQRLDARRRLLAVKLQHSGFNASTTSSSSASSASTDERHFLRTAGDAPPSAARRVERDMPWRRRKEHEADHVGAGVERDVERFRRGKTADFDYERHAPATDLRRNAAVLHGHARLVLHAAIPGPAA